MVIKTFALIARTTRVSQKDLTAMAKAIDKQLKQDFCPAFGMSPMQCIVKQEGDFLKDWVMPIYFDDKPDPQDAGADGYHDEPHGKPEARVFCEPVLDAGGGVLDTGKIGDGISLIASHEVLEAAHNPNVNLWVDGPLKLNGVEWASVCAEVGDPVQADYYMRDGVALSNFTLPAWFDPMSAGPWDWMKKCTGPMSCTSGGYLIVRNDPSSEQSVGARREWRQGTRSLRILSRGGQ
jgi:hypothetical protein